jgi:hypothetical protein
MKLVSSDGQQHNLTLAQIAIGRGPNNTIIINDPRVSTNHATLTRDASGAYVLADNSSTNGTSVNNMRLASSHRLRPHDVISLGGYVLTVQGDYPAAPPLNKTVVAPEPPPLYHGQEVGGQHYPPQPQYNYGNAPVQPPYVPPQQQVYNAPYAPPPSYSGGGTKDKSLAYIFELAGGFFGFMGIGWMYTGNVLGGIVLLIGNWMFLIFAALLSLASGGLFACCALPLEIAFWLSSMAFLSSYINKHPEMFR